MMKKRILWILNHKTLLPAEVPILESLGFEIFTPSDTPDQVEFSSAKCFKKTGTTTLSSDVIDQLNAQSFYTDDWSPEVASLINSAFDAVITSVYEKPLSQSLTKFSKPVIARIFGREAESTYDQLLNFLGCDELIHKRQEPFLVAQAYDELKEIEPAYIASRMRTVGCSVPHHIWDQTKTWRRTNDNILFLCPRISRPYYCDHYRTIKSIARSLPHKIIGVQPDPFDDPAVLGFISDDDLYRLYRSAAAFAYVSEEKRHLHYTPIECIIFGMPVLYFEGSMLSRIAGRKLLGECCSQDDMRTKSERIARGDELLSSSIVAEQDELLAPFRTEVVTQQWRAVFSELGMMSVHNQAKEHEQDLHHGPGVRSQS